MTKISKKSLPFLHILFSIYLLVTYYGKLFCIDAGDSPVDIPTRISEKEGITFFTFSFSKILDVHRALSVIKMKEISNEYLRIVLLPSLNLLKPYKNGTGIYDIIESLYVDSVYEDEAFVYMNVVYITSPLEYSYVREQEKVKL